MKKTRIEVLAGGVIGICDGCRSRSMPGATADAKTWVQNHRC